MVGDIARRRRSTCVVVRLRLGQRGWIERVREEVLLRVGLAQRGKCVVLQSSQSRGGPNRSQLLIAVFLQLPRFVVSRVGRLARLQRLVHRHPRRVVVGGLLHGRRSVEVVVVVELAGDVGEFRVDRRGVQRLIAGERFELRQAAIGGEEVLLVALLAHLSERK